MKKLCFFGVFDQIWDPQNPQNSQTSESREKLKKHNLTWDVVNNRYFDRFYQKKLLKKTRKKTHIDSGQIGIPTYCG